MDSTAQVKEIKQFESQMILVICSETLPPRIQSMQLGCRMMGLPWDSVGGVSWRLRHSLQATLFLFGTNLQPVCDVVLAGSVVGVAMVVVKVVVVVEAASTIVVVGHLYLR